MAAAFALRVAAALRAGRTMSLLAMFAALGGWLRGERAPAVTGYQPLSTGAVSPDTVPAQPSFVQPPLRSMPVVAIGDELLWDHVTTLPQIVAFVKALEVFHAEPHDNGFGYWTIGYGALKDPAGQKVTRHTTGHARSGRSPDPARLRRSGQ